MLDFYEVVIFNVVLYFELKVYVVVVFMCLVVECGEFEDLVGMGMCNVYFLVIVLNVISFIICGGVSLSIELMVVNVFF